MDKNIKKCMKSGSYHRKLKSTREKYKLMIENLKLNLITNQQSKDNNVVEPHPVNGMSNPIHIFFVTTAKHMINIVN